ERFAGIDGGRRGWWARLPARREQGFERRAVLFRGASILSAVADVLHAGLAAPAGGRVELGVVPNLGAFPPNAPHASVLEYVLVRGRLPLARPFSRSRSLVLCVPRPSRAILEGCRWTMTPVTPARRCRW